jgi:diadenylate cyclase
MVDFVVLAATLYVLLRWAQQGRALRVALMVAGLHAGALVARGLDLAITSWVLDGAAALTILLLLLVFQSELRRFFMRLDGVLNWRWRASDTVEEVCQAMSRAAFRMASADVGALIIIVRGNSVNELVSDGIALDATVSAEILEAIFQKTSPVHDGAVIVKGGQIIRAAAVLPLTERDRVPSYFGTRHRAAMGLVERCDALAVVVSEQRGEVTLMDGRRVTRVDDEPKLAQLLEKLSTHAAPDWRSRVRGWLFSNLRVKAGALGLAALIWTASFLPAGTTVRSVNVPVEFVGVPAGMDIASSVDRLEVQVRGSPWLMDSVGLSRLVARFSMRGAHAGAMDLPVDQADLDLPPGIVMERVAPAKISVRLVLHKP